MCASEYANFHLLFWSFCLFLEGNKFFSSPKKIVKWKQVKITNMVLYLWRTEVLYRFSKPYSNLRIQIVVCLAKRKSWLFSPLSSKNCGNSDKNVDGVQINSNWIIDGIVFLHAVLRMVFSPVERQIEMSVTYSLVCSMLFFCKHLSLVVNK